MPTDKSHGPSAGSRADHGGQSQGYRAELAIVAGWFVNAYEGREGRGAFQPAQLFHDESEFVRPWKVAQGIFAAPPHAPYRASAFFLKDRRGEIARQARLQRRRNRYWVELRSPRRLPIDDAQPHHNLQREGAVRPRPRGSNHRTVGSGRREKGPDVATALSGALQSDESRPSARDRHGGLPRCLQRPRF